LVEKFDTGIPTCWHGWKSAPVKPALPRRSLAMVNTNTMPCGRPEDQLLMQCFNAIRTNNDLSPDQRAVALMCKFAMHGYLAYPCTNGGYWLGFEGTLTYLRNFNELGQGAARIGINL
jgi:hypothetical protein